VTASESQFLTYSESGRVLLETNAIGTLAKFSLTHGYDSLLRQTSLTVCSNATSLYAPTYAYDSTSSRLTNVADGAYSAAYNCLANSPLVSQITLRSNSFVAMTTTKQYDYLNRLLNISSQPSASGEQVVSFGYTYNDANQRTRRTDPDGSYWLYEYDKLGQLTSGKHYWPDGTPVAGQQFEYGYDDIGNRSSTKEGGDATGAGLRSATYGANALNQYPNRTVPGAADIIGIAHANASVTNNGEAAYRKGEYFWKELSISNASAAIWQSVTNIASLTGTNQTNTGNLFIPKTPETFGYDADGNLTNDGRFTYTWDAENRLLKAESLSTGPTASKRKVEWTFDAKGRRVRQTTSDGSSGSYVVTEDLKFFCDGWQSLAELNATNNAVIRTYLWGLDLSGSMTGAGRVGGLLAMNSVSSGMSFYAYDGNGNVVALVASAGEKSVRYEYDPFGRTLRTSATPVSENTYRFSTKRANDTTDHALYEFRANNPATGRWLNRDSLGETADRNLYLSLQNVPTSNLDADGRKCLDNLIRWHTNQSTMLLTSKNHAKSICGTRNNDPNDIPPACSITSFNVSVRCCCNRRDRTWRLTYDGSFTCNVYLADPALNVQWIPNPPGRAGAEKHERCHCGKDAENFYAALDSLISPTFTTRAQCDESKAGFQIRLQLNYDLLNDSNVDHSDPDFIGPDGRCYAEGYFL
jgi:RHS repeat-associated protein